MLAWFPDVNAGTYTGQAQGRGRSRATPTTSSYGGEFTKVNFKAQQGLVRFAGPALRPTTDGPRLQNAEFVPTVTSSPDGR